MSTIMGKTYATDWKGQPPHMLRQDVPVWYRFLDKWGFMFKHMWYDVLLGGPALTPSQLNDPYWLMWRANTSKRADALAETETELWIIEVATTPGLRAVGQLLVYQSLWIEDPKITKPEILVLVCRDVDTDLISSAARVGIHTYVTPA